jgi:hypothetical protein
MEGLYREIVGTVANVAVKHNDEQLKILLESQGFNVSVDSMEATGTK